MSLNLFYTTLFSFFSFFQNSNSIDKSPTDVKIEKKPIPTTTIVVKSEGERFPLMVTQSKQKLVLQNLEIGEEYEFFLTSSRQNEPNGKIYFNGKNIGSPQVFKALSTTATLDIDIDLLNNGRNVSNLYYLTYHKSGHNQIPSIANAVGNKKVAITTTPGGSALDLIKNVLIGTNCFEVTLVSQTGIANQYGSFNNGSTSVGFDQGVIMSTGNVNQVGQSSNVSASTAMQGGGATNDPNLTGNNLNDKVVFEFDLKPTTSFLSFQYVFASEEYCQYVNTNFNDQFGFFISGPGIAGTQNMATLPTTTTASNIVSINNVNHGTNSAYYYSNKASNAIFQMPGCTGHPTGPTTPNPASINECVFNGFTTPLTASAVVQPCQTYRLRLVIADVADKTLDSAVFLKGDSFNAEAYVIPSIFNATNQNISEVNEGCENGVLKIRRPPGADITIPKTVTWSMTGSTATAGLDYVPFGTSAVIPAGQNCIEIPITILLDQLNESNEVIKVTVNESCKCSAYELTIKDPPLIVTMNDVTVCSAASVTLAPIVTGGFPNYTYTWSPNGSGNSTTFTATTLPSITTYTVTVTDMCGHVKIDDAKVTVQGVPTANMTSTTGSLCAGGNTTLNVNLTGTPPWQLTYTLNGVAQAPVTINSTPYSLTVTQAGTYAISGVKYPSSSCQGTFSGSAIVQQSNPDATITKTNVSCNAANNGTMSISGLTGGIAPYTYLWSNSSISQNLTGLSPGTYTVTITDNIGCTKIKTENITEPPILIATTSASTAQTCIAQGTGTVSVTGGTTPYMYLWNDPSNTTSQNLSGAPAGTYILTVTDSKGCQDTAKVIILPNNTLPTAVATANVTINCATPIVPISGIGSSIGANFTYNWSGTGIASGGTTLNPNINAGGTYILTVTNTNNGCTQTASVVIAENKTLPTAVTLTPPPITCGNPSISISAVGSSVGTNFTYNWSGPSIVSGGTTLTPTVNQVGTYTITVTDNDNGCTKTATVTVIENKALPTADAGADKLLNCFNNQSVSIGTAAIGGFTYNWSNNVTTATQTVTASGTYTLTVTDPINGCTKTDVVVVTEDIVAPILSPIPPVTVNCFTPNPTLLASATGSNLVYTWSPSGPSISAGGTYTVTVTNSVNGCTDTESIIVPEDKNDPTAVIAPPAILTCGNNSSILLDATGSSTGAIYTYNWTGPASFSSTTIPPANATVAGTYTLTVTNTINGCKKIASVNVTENKVLPTADAGTDKLLSCFNNQSVSIGTPSIGNFTYNWSNNVTTATQTVTTAGTYTLTVTDPVNGCTKTDVVVVTEDIVAPVISPIPVVTVNCFTPNPTLNTSVVGSNLTYAWSPSGSGANPSISVGGTYTVTVTNSVNGCTDTESVIVPEDKNDPTAIINFSNPIYCNNLTATLNTTGSSTGTNFTYNWSSPSGFSSTNENPSITAGGTYNLTITNTTNGCKKTASVTVPEDKTTPAAAIVNTPTITCANGTVQINAAGATGANFTYNWAASNGGNISGGGTTLTPTVNQAGTYTLTVTNTTTGCTNTAQAIVNEDKVAPVINTTGTGIVTCTNPVLNLGTTIVSGSNLQFQWSSPTGGIVGNANQQNISVNLGGTYTVTVTNSFNGCSTTSSITTTQDNTPPTVNAIPSGIIDCINTSASINGTTSSQGSNFAYTWSGPAGFTNNSTLSPTVTVGGAYTLSITNTTNGCINSKTIVVSEDKLLPAVSIFPPTQLNCSNPSIFIFANGSTSYLYSWTTTNGGNIVSGGSSNNVLVNQVGTYNLNVINPQNGCQFNASTNVTENKTIPTVSIATPSEITCPQPFVILNANGSSVGANYQIVWTPNPILGQGTLTPTINVGGAYTLKITDTSNGCEKSETVTVIDQRVYPVAVIAIPTNLDCNITSLILDASASSNGSNFLYNWSTTNGGNITNGQNTLTPSINAPGTYTLQINNTNNGCAITQVVSVLQNISQPNADAGPAKVITCVSNSVQLQGSGSSGFQYQYQWSNNGGNISNTNGGNTLSPTVSQVGTYTLTVKDVQNGCTQSSTTNVSLDLGVPTANAGSKKEINCNIPQVTLDGTASSTGATFTYTWTTVGGAFVSGQNTLQPIVNQPGSYNLEIINTANGCKGNASVQVEDNRTKPTLKIAKFSILNCANSSLTLNANGSSAGTNFTYTWTGTGIVSGATTLSPIINKAGLYTFKIKNSQNGCEKDSIVTIIENTNKPNPLIATPLLLTCTQPTQILDASASTKIQNAKIQWITSVLNGISAGANTLKPTIVDEGDYKLILTDTISKCKDSIVVNVKKDANIPQANAGATTELNCTIKDITLTGTGSSGANITYSWTTVSGNIVSGGTTLTPKINAAGKYTLKVFNSTNQCTKESSVDITQDTLKPTLKIAKPAILNCKTTVMPLDASASSTGANFSFNWTTPSNVTFVSGGTTLSPLVNKPGTYSITMTNTKTTCIAQNSVIVTQDIVKPQASIAKTDTLNCRNFSLKLKGNASANSGFYTFEWKTPPNGIVKDATSLEPSINQPGDYQLVVTDTSNFCAATAQISVIKNILTPIVDAGLGGNLTCTIKDLILKGTASNGVPSDLIYSWTTPNGNIVGASNILNIKTDLPGKYFFEVENKVNGCKSTDSTSVTQDANVPKVEILTNGDLDCKTKTLELDGTGSSQGSGITFTWSTKNGGNIITGQNTLKPTINSAGVYILQINNSNNNCIKEIEKTIKIDTIKPVINVTQDLITCAKPKVELSGNIFQANQFTFEWITTTGGILSNKDSLQIQINKKGIYTLKVKNTENECENSKIVNVLEDKILPTTDAGATLEINCQDSILTLQGEKSSKGNEFVYNWTTTNIGRILADEKTLNPKIDKAAPYFLLITNKNNGCQNRDTVVIKINKIVPLITIVKPDTLTCKKPNIDLKANATVTGSSGNYEWSTANGNILNGKTSPTTTVDKPGLYLLQVMDTKNFCKSNKQVDVPIDTIKPKVNAGANIELNCKSPTIEVSAIATAKQALTLLWTTSNGTIVKDADQLKVTVKSAGIYQLTATNNVNGCKASDEMEVTFLGAPKAIILPPQVLTCAKTNVVLDSKGSDTGSNITYTWSDNNGNSLGTSTTLNITKPGTYNFKVLNTNNECEKKIQIDVTQDIVAPTADAGQNGVIDCEKGFVLVNGKNSSQGIKYKYQWSGGLIESGATTLEAKVTAQAIYTLLVTNSENGCQTSDTVSVLSLKPALLETVANQPLCYGNKGSIFIKTVSGGTPPFSYSIDGGINFYNYTTFNGLKAGEYVVFVQDSKGCEDSSSVELINPEKFMISIPSINKVKIGDDIQLQASVNPTNPPLKSITWSPDSNLICKNCLNPIVIKPLRSMYFTLKVVNQNGCVATTFTNIEVDNKIGIFAPSVFSPNNDNSNDRFMLFGNPELVLRIKWLKVYDRWGDNVYSETDIKVNDLARGWDGNLAGNPMNPAVFVWDAEVEFIDGTKKILKGDLTLMR